MNKEQIIKDNKLIAEFMGLEKNDFGYWVNKDYLFGAQLKLFDFELKFHSSWDWLMPVWFGILKWGKSEYGINWEQSIGEMFIDIKINKGELEINWLNTNRIEDVWFVVVEFIKWYNSCQKEKYFPQTN